jgi:prevent-host-death family protein
MADVQVGIGQVKRDISELINRVAYGGERIILTSRGKPKAAIISLEDYEKLNQLLTSEILARWEAWLAESADLTDEILRRRQGKPLDVDALSQATRADLGFRDVEILGS